MPRERAKATRAAAEIIEAARLRHVPLLTLSEAARRAGITPAGWRKVISTGRGRDSTFIAMARVTGVEDDVREQLGMERTEAIPGLPPMSDDERRAVLSYLEVRRAVERRGA